MTALTAALALMASGCDWRFDRPPPIVGDGGDIDAMIGGPDASIDDDASPPCVADTIVCDDDLGRYVDCSATGTVELEMQCPLGCATAEEKCLDVDPSNGLAAYLDMAVDGPDVDFTGQSLLREGVVFNNGVSIEVPSEIVNGMYVYMFGSLRISGTLTDDRQSYRTLPIALLVAGDVTIEGLLDVSAGRAGGNPGWDGDVIACNGGSHFGPNPTAGGTGAGAAHNGGSGGPAGNGAMPSAGGGASGDSDLEPLTGGCSGGLANESGAYSVGGSGGGGVQIVSRTRISLLGNGSIDASGAGGYTATIASGTIAGGGGGAGGNVLLEAPQVVLDGASVVISTKGGSGGAAGSGGTFSGSAGGLAAGPTPGGTNPSAADGGAGGTRNVAPIAGEPGGTAGADGGGGGGSVGRARFNTRSGFISPVNGAAIYSNYDSFNPTLLRTRTVPVDPG